MKKSERVGFVLSKELKDKLKEKSKKTGIPMSEIVRRGIEKQLNY